MITISLKSLVDKMSPTLRDALEGAAGLCIGRGHYNVEIEHWLLQLLATADSDLHQLLQRHDIDTTRVVRDLTRAVDQFRSGSSRPAALSPALVEAAKNGWMLASIDFGHGRLTSGHLLAALLLDESSRRQLVESVPSLAELAPESLRAAARTLVGATRESALACSTGSLGELPDGGVDTVAPSKTPALDRFTVNLTERAQRGGIDPVLGRDEEVRQCIDILTRRRQNNPILTGEAGVGKTAVVEGFALRIAQGDVPTPLKGVAIRTLDLGLLQAGAAVKGEFESRLRAVIDEVKASVQPVILFIDEAHTLIGAGGKEGQGDAANLLKPALARGELRTIAATTWAEYKKYFERDPALTRRFQLVKVEEPSEAVAIDMMRGIAPSLEHHHCVRILDEAIVASVTLSHRYLPNRQLPDKSVSLLDTACARVALSHTATPAPIEESQRLIRQAETTIALLAKEDAAGADHQERLSLLRATKDAAEQRLAVQQGQWRQEQALIDEMRELRQRLEQNHLGMQSPPALPPLSALDVAALKSRLALLTQELEAVQGDAPLMQAAVDEQAVAAVVASWTGVPVGKMVANEIDKVRTLATHLEQRIIGQAHAVTAIAQAIRTSRAGLTDPRKPIGVFMLVGTSGVGKTETALALADLLYGGEHNITTINMAEFKEEHKVSMLLGSPPGYVGYGEGGILTEAARRKPYSIILLDEMEKAHPGVQDIFYNLFDKGTIKDGEGRDIDFKNTVVIMTSNAGEGAIRAICDQLEERPEPDVLLDNIRPLLLQHFKPAFLGRTNLIAYYPLDDEELMKIAALSMQRIEGRVTARYGVPLSYDEDVLLHLVARCHEADTGARNIENILNRTLLPELASRCLDRLADQQAIESVHIGVTAEGAFAVTLG